MTGTLESKCKVGNRMQILFGFLEIFERICMEDRRYYFSGGMPGGKFKKNI